MPCCVAGALFILNIMAFVRWFKRTILRKEPDEYEENFWTPPRVKLRDKLKSIFSDRKRRKIIIGFLVFEAVLVAVIWLAGGFEYIQHGIEVISADQDVSLEHIGQCCVEK
ncbi:MAG TPA: hypothetical protein GXX36_15210 [Clostridiaceae bacterium]|nr:hypothetical protein [Clostridiaceae bacterium]